MVNRDRYPANVAIKLTSGDPVFRLINGQPVVSGGIPTAPPTGRPVAPGGAAASTRPAVAPSAPVAIPPAGGAVAPGSTVSIQLEPYQLVGFRTSPRTSIASVQVVVAQEWLNAVRGMIHWTANAARNPAQAFPGRSPTSADLTALDRAAQDASNALTIGHSWAARTRLERLDLIEIFERLGAYPPGLR
jgi:hypothetical protein